MDIERLKELRNRVLTEIDDQTGGLTDEDLERIITLIDAEIARQSVKSEEVADAIDALKVCAWRNPDMNKQITLAITALQAYQPWIPFSERLPTEEDADGNANVMCLFADNAIETWVWNEITEWNLDNARKDQGFVGITHWRPMLPEPPKGE